MLIKEGLELLTLLDEREFAQFLDIATLVWIGPRNFYVKCKFVTILPAHVLDCLEKAILRSRVCHNGLADELHFLGIRIRFDQEVDMLTKLHRDVG